MLDEPLVATLEVIAALEALGVPYFIGGSLASAIYGVLRATLDADLVADLRLEHVEPLTRTLRESFYVDAQSMCDAILRPSSFNVIHLETMFKVDVFVLKRRPFNLAQLDRRVRQRVTDEPPCDVYVASAEDTILAKLEWYRMGGHISERQWRDVLGVLRVQRNQLDYVYLRHWAMQLEIDDLLERALGEASQ